MSEQLIKKNQAGGYNNVMPNSWIESIRDKSTGQTLTEILQGFNMYFLPYNGNTSETRCLVPMILRKKGLWITYVKYDGNVYTEWYAATSIDDTSWGDSSNWRVGNNTLVGDITISANGNWVINGVETEFKAVGEKGNTPLIRVANNKLQVSYDLGDTYIDITNNPVYTKFRWLATTGDTQANNVGRIQASIDEGKTWANMSNDFTNNLHISRYIGINDSLPTSGIAEGTIYAKGPYYAEDDTLNDNPIYRLWVYAWKSNTLAWQDNGEFTSIVAGVVQETGDSETEVMSQKATTEKLTELASKVSSVIDINVSFIYDKLWNSVTGSLDNYQGRICSSIMPYNENCYIDTDGVITDFIYWKNGIYIGESKTFGGFTDANQISWNYKKDALPTYAIIKGIIKSKLDNIDEEPKQNSQNLSYSGGIEKRIVKSENGFTLQGNYYDNNGELQKHETIRCTELLPIDDESYVISFNTSGGSSYSNFVFFDENKSFISSLIYSIKPNGELCVLSSDNFPSGAKYIAANADNTDKYLSPFIIITNFGGINNYFGKLLLSERVITNWTDAGTPSKSYYSDLIPVSEDCEISTMNPYVSFFRVILYDAGKNIIYNDDISFKDGEAKGEGGSSGRFEGHTYNIPLGYGISYVKLQYLEENSKPNIFINYKRIGTQLAELYCGVNAISGQKVVTIGDSLTENCVWQPYLAKYKNLKWSKEETLSGVGYVSLVDGTYTTEDKSDDSSYRKAYPMAVGGTTMRPGSNQSIYIRALDAVHYNPDIILLYGGENDGISMVTGNNPWGDTSLSAKDLVEQTPAYTDGVISYDTNAMAAYKGLIELLSEKCPKTKIYLVAPMRCRCEIGMTATGGAFEGTIRFKDMSDVLDYDNKDRLKRWGYIKALGEYYGLPVIDLMNNCGATHYNEKDWYSDPAYDCTQVHPNDYGYMMMAKCMATYL